MFSVQEKTKSVWGVEDLPCISLSAGVSTMHKLRWDIQHSLISSVGASTHQLFVVIPPVTPTTSFSSLWPFAKPFHYIKLTSKHEWHFIGRPQPSWDRTCTAAAAIGLLSELQVLPQFSSYGLDKQNEALENAVDVLLEALTARRLRMGRSITRRLRHSSNIC